MRWVLLLGLCVCAGCAGGQTGEITEPTRCTERTEEPLAEAERVEIERLGAPWTGTLTWDEDGSSSDLTVSFAPAEGTAFRLGGEGCEEELREVPVELRADTTDGLLRESLAGTLEWRPGTTYVTVPASRPAARIEGSLDLSSLAPAETARLLVVLERMEGSTAGQIFVAPGDGRDEQRIAAW